MFESGVGENQLYPGFSVKCRDQTEIFLDVPLHSATKSSAEKVVCGDRLWKYSIVIMIIWKIRHKISLCPREVAKRYGPSESVIPDLFWVMAEKSSLMPSVERQQFASWRKWHFSFVFFACSLRMLR